MSIDTFYFLCCDPVQCSKDFEEFDVEAGFRTVLILFTVSLFVYKFATQGLSGYGRKIAELRQHAAKRKIIQEKDTFFKDHKDSKNGDNINFDSIETLIHDLAQIIKRAQNNDKETIEALKKTQTLVMQLKQLFAQEKDDNLKVPWHHPL